MIERHHRHHDERFEEPSESEVHALPIAPDVDVARALDLGEGKKIYYSDRDLFFTDGEHFYPIVVRGYPRLVGPSPDGDAVAFLEPAEFEMAANLYVFDVPARTLRSVTEHNDETSTLSVKAARWFDEHTIYYLEGYRYGTVSRGGDLWKVDLATMERRPIVRVTDKSDGRFEIVEFEFVPGHKLIRYVVAHYDEYGNETRKAHYCTLDGKPIGRKRQDRSALRRRPESQDKNAGKKHATHWAGWTPPPAWTAENRRSAGSMTKFNRSCGEGTCCWATSVEGRKPRRAGEVGLPTARGFVAGTARNRPASARPKPQAARPPAP